MVLVPKEEYILQTSKNVYMVYSLINIAVEVYCPPPSPAAPNINLDIGINKVQVPPSCIAEFIDYAVIGDACPTVQKRLLPIRWNPSWPLESAPDMQQVGAWIPELE